MCRVLGVSPSGYYAWRKRGLSRRRREDAALLERVRRVWEGSGRTYGAPRVWAELRACGVRCSRKRLSAADAGGGAGGGLPPEATEEDHGAEPTGSRSSGPGGAAVPGGRPRSSCGWRIWSTCPRRKACCTSAWSWTCGAGGSWDGRCARMPGRRWWWTPWLERCGGAGLPPA
jgi:hypothetical protein